MKSNESGILLGFSNLEQFLDWLTPKYKKANEIIRQNIKSRYLYNTYMIAIIEQWDNEIKIKQWEKEIKEKEKKKKVEAVEKVEE